MGCKSVRGLVVVLSLTEIEGAREGVFNGFSEKLKSDVAVMQGSVLAPTLITIHQILKLHSSQPQIFIA